MTGSLSPQVGNIYRVSILNRDISKFNNLKNFHEYVNCPTSSENRYLPQAFVIS